jgi:hypothetical protein
MRQINARLRHAPPSLTNEPTVLNLAHHHSHSRSRTPTDFMESYAE